MPFQWKIRWKCILRKSNFHQILPTYQCSLCDKNFTEKGRLKKHTRNVHEGIDTKKIICTFCSKKFTYQSELKIHVGWVHEGKTFLCSFCNKTYRESSRKSHMKYTHGGKDTFHNCPHCDYKSLHKFHTDKHIKSIHEGLTHQCPKCDFIAKWKTQLGAHIMH